MDIHLRMRPPGEEEISSARKAINDKIAALKLRLFTLASGASVLFAGFFFFISTRNVSPHLCLAGVVFCCLCLRRLMPELLHFADSIDTRKSSLTGYMAVSETHHNDLVRLCMRDPLVCNVYAGAVEAQGRLLTFAESRAIISYVGELQNMQSSQSKSSGNLHATGLP